MIASETRKRYGSAFVRLYTGESDDFDKRRDFADAAAAWGEAIAVIFTGTVSVGVSANTPHIDEVFAFFKYSNAAATASTQMLFRARQVKRITIDVGGMAAHGLPQTRDALMQWATREKNRGQIPDCFRHDRCPTIAAPTASDPAALDEVVRGFEGRMWVAAMLDHLRSQTDLVERMGSILARAGLDVSLVDLGRRYHHRKGAQTTLAPTKPRTKKAKTAREAKLDTPFSSGEPPEPPRSQVMADGVGDAIERECQGLDPERDRTHAEKAGDRGLSLARTFRVDPREIDARWIATHEPLAMQYRRLVKTVEQTHIEAPTLSLRSEKAACALAVKVLATLGVDVEALTSGMEVGPDRLEAAAKALSGEINARALALYDDRHRGRREKAGIKTARAQRGILGIPLRHIGIMLEPTYATTGAKKRGADPTGAKIVLAWERVTSKGDGYPAPHPPYPCAPAQTQAERAWDPAGAAVEDDAPAPQ